MNALSQFLCDYYKLYIEPSELIVDSSVIYPNLIYDPILSPHSLGKFNIDPLYEFNYAAGLSHNKLHNLHKENPFQCTRYIRRVQMDYGQLFLPRHVDENDLLVAIYVPPEITRFNLEIGNEKRTIVVEEDEFENAPIETIIHESKKCNDVSDTKPYIVRELEFERNRNGKVECKVLESDKLEFDGIVYKRVRIAVPFLPVVSLAYTEVQIYFETSCQIIAEWALLPSLLYGYMRMGDIYSMYKHVTGKNGIDRIDANRFTFQTVNQNMENNREVWQVVLGKCKSRQVEEEKDEVKLETLFYDRENNLMKYKSFV